MSIHKSKQGRRIVILITICSAILFINNVGAQSNLEAESAKIQEAYKNPSYLSFDLQYTFAAETTPTVIDDSINGTFKISGNYYWGTLDSLEYMQNSSYAIFLYKSNKILNVNNPTISYPQGANFSLMDSLIGKNNYSTSLSDSASVKILTMTFSDPDFPYKNFSVYYDSTSYLINKVCYVIKEDFYDTQDSYNQSVGSNASDYIVVTIKYFNYSTSAFSNTVFNTGNYFIIYNGDYIPQPPFTDYEVFLGSPNLFLTHQSLD